MISPSSPSDAHRRNTNMVDGLDSHRSRSWFFTLNNYTVTDCAQLPTAFSKYSARKYIFQEEIGENKTPHLQGIVTFKEKVSFKNMKKINSRIHWEVPKKTRACFNYCQKEETRKPDGMRWIYPPTDEEKVPIQEINRVLYESMIQTKVEIDRSDLPSGFFEVSKPEGIDIGKPPSWWLGEGTLRYAKKK